MNRIDIPQEKYDEHEEYLVRIRTVGDDGRRSMAPVVVVLFTAAMFAACSLGGALLIMGR